MGLHLYGSYMETVNMSILECKSQVKSDPDIRKVNATIWIPNTNCRPHKPRYVVNNDDTWMIIPGWRSVCNSLVSNFYQNRLGLEDNVHWSLCSWKRGRDVWKIKLDWTMLNLKENWVSTLSDTWITIWLQYSAKLLAFAVFSKAKIYFHSVTMCLKKGGSTMLQSQCVRSLKAGDWRLWKTLKTYLRY